MNRRNPAVLSGMCLVLVLGCGSNTPSEDSKSSGGTSATRGGAGGTTESSSGEQGARGGASSAGAQGLGGNTTAGAQGARGGASSAGAQGLGGASSAGAQGDGGKTSAGAQGLGGRGGTESGGASSGGNSSGGADGGNATGRGGGGSGGAVAGGDGSGGTSAGGVTTASGGTAEGGTTTGSGGIAEGGAATAAGGNTSTCVLAAPTACTAAPTVQITEVSVDATVLYNENDADLKLLSISPVPSGGSRVAFVSGEGLVHITNLDCNDEVESAFTLPGMDYGDLYADDAGGVVLLTRDAQGGGTLNCGIPTNLCGTPPSPAIACYDQYLVRFDGATETWATKLTPSSAALPPYSTGPTGPDVIFIWAAYAHHGRIAFDGTNWASYYAAAVSTSQDCTTGGNTAINIHQGDAMKVVGPTGTLLDGHNSFDWGCSHSGFEKVLWDPSAARFVMICRSDAYPQPGLNVNAANLVSDISPSDSSISNVVLASGGGYWILASDGGTLHLLRFTTGASTEDINLGSGDEPHLVNYGSHLLATWVPASGGDMVGQILDASTGAALGATFPVAVPSNQFQDFRGYSDGSAAYVAPGSTNTTLKIVRVLPCQ